LVLCGIVDDVLLNCVNENYIINKKKSLFKNIPNDPIFYEEQFKKFGQSLTLKELLIYSNDELYNKFIGYNNQVLLIKQTPISHVVKDFLVSNLYAQRTMLIQLLVNCDNPEFQYLAYLLYDLLSNDVNGNIDTIEQTTLYESFPWPIKRYFSDAMKSTIKYTNNLSNIDHNKIPLEQQICLMKVCENVKEKAMTKLKEVKSKTDDSGSKARQYLDGLLKIPFGVYKKEDILCIFKEMNDDFKNNLEKIKNHVEEIPIKEKYNLLEINKYNILLKDKYRPIFQNAFIVNLKKNEKDTFYCNKKPILREILR